MTEVMAFPRIPQGRINTLLALAYCDTGAPEIFLKGSVETRWKWYLAAEMHGDGH